VAVGTSAGALTSTHTKEKLAEATSTLNQALQPHNNLDLIKDHKGLCDQSVG